VGHGPDLRHVYEGDPSLVDALDDTPTTDAETNLMHWNASADPNAHALTAEQIGVLRAHPAAH
jgi:hypothetical protein